MIFFNAPAEMVLEQRSTSESVMCQGLNAVICEMTFVTALLSSRTFELDISAIYICISSGHINPNCLQALVFLDERLNNAELRFDLGRLNVVGAARVGAALVAFVDIDALFGERSAESTTCLPASVRRLNSWNTIFTVADLPGNTARRR